MAYVKIWIHCVWGTKRRQSFLTKDNKPVIMQHIKDNAKQKKIYIDQVNGCTEHLHALIKLTPDQSIAKVIQLIKGESSYWINKNKILPQFEWADEYYAASVSESQVQVIRNYIREQERHHAKKTWTDECNEFVTRYGFEKMLG